MAAGGRGGPGTVRAAGARQGDTGCQARGRRSPPGPVAGNPEMRMVYGNRAAESADAIIQEGITGCARAFTSSRWPWQISNGRLSSTAADWDCSHRELLAQNSPVTT